MLIIGGEALAGSRLSVWRQHAPEVQFVNEYGPTETVVGCCTHTASEQDFGGESVPIGRPIANTRVYVLDRRLNPLPSGIPGELYIGGDGVCRGYLERPAITAERFVPDEFSDTSGSRMYRTGDLVVQKSDGVLCFLGRLDSQVKIRSYRIELGEIEAQLELHPAVSQSVVVARTLPNGDKSLLAYIQCSNAGHTTADELRAFLLQKLPEYMVPAGFVLLDKLPLNAHGKVDRGALPDPETARATDSRAYEPPRTPAEVTLVSIWCEVLKAERIGIHDDFFRSGGDSIQSILVVARAAKAGLRFTTRDLFRNPTIAALAAVAEQNGTAVASACDAHGTVPLMPIQNWFFQRYLPNPHHFNQSVMLDVHSDLRVDGLRQVLEELVARHDALRLRFTRQADGWLQVYSAPQGTVIVEDADLEPLSACDRQSTYESLIARAQSRLDISHGPLMRAVLFHLGPAQPAKLLLTVHHLVIDGVSWRILLDDIAAACQQVASGQPIQLAPKASSFKAWSSRLDAYANSDLALCEADFWTRRASTGRIPVDFATELGENTIAASASVRVTLGRDETSTLLHRISHVYRTDVEDLLLTALARALTHWNGSRVNLVDSEGHGREDLFPDVDASRTVGWFTSIYPMYLDLTGAHGPGEELKAIKEQRRRIPRRGIGYGLLRYLSRDKQLRDRLEALPHPEVSFNYLGAIDEVNAGPILGVASVEMDGEQDPMSRRPYLLDVIAHVKNGLLHLQIVYSTALHRPATIEHLAKDALGNIELLLDHCLSPSAGGFTPSDFPDVALSQAELDELEAEFE
jgi:non-ribosomal peptide synthase protein (TIGR01720 family)